MRTRLVLALLAACLVPSSAFAADTAVDIELAIDTTGSMTPSIENAKKDARKIVAETQQTLPNARFAIVQFRDDGDKPEYEVVQKLTASADDVSAAINKLSADGGGDSPEAYNLVFQKAVTAQDELGLRAGSRKILFVLGDAEPHGAGNGQDLAGCSDKSDDPHKLSSRDVLKAMRGAEITLNLVLQRSSAQTTLECYQSLASAAYGNGKASESGDAGGCGGRCPPPCDPGPERPCPVMSPGVSGGGSDGGGSAKGMALSETVARGIAREFPAVTFSGPRAWHAGRAARSSIGVTNHAPKPARLTSVTITLPAGFKYVRGSTRGLTRRDPSVRGRRLTWIAMRTLASKARTALSFVARPGAGGGKARIAARFVMADGGRFTARRAARTKVS